MDINTSFSPGPMDSVFTVPTFTPINNELAIAEIKIEANETDTMTSPAEQPSPAATTPRKRTRKKTNTDANADADAAESPTKKGKGTPKTSLGPVPTSLASAGLADKMILRMRDGEGRSWTDITAAWTTMTGIKVEGSTLRKRYTAMKANFVSFSAEDEARILKVKKEVEDKFEQEKWQKISEGVEADGGGKYPAMAIQKKIKELSKKGQAAASVEDEE
ncbi:uncharacterized protein ACLA_007450 [Aspergillus clavatus NRRL 1]|uniref:Myb-like domain-containing protein n=1 Tax=Aspergillus clavatus (strain ATCC 1007 / CBS 513.65 / DSM 816 / NCTC 3887 / NRRL 1 / QM 1276 / 107) TaxID=344612 RepID=A1CDQ9_ASPCL|nr:uncharacterized protein ACLA_007450 [Aspergillus clavatus NRRL 1]EAW11986.1 conserved hypothetical protein [Aspergillus clavatus NRRL 1]